MAVVFKGKTLKNVIPFINMRSGRELEIARLYTEEYGTNACVAVEYDTDDAAAIAWFTGVDIPEGVEDIGILGIHFDSICARTVHGMVRTLGFHPQQDLMNRGELDTVVWRKTADADIDTLVPVG